MNQRRLLALLLVLPSLAVALVGLVWFAGRMCAPHFAARVWTATTEPLRVLLRAQIVSFPDRRALGRTVGVSVTVTSGSSGVRRLYGQSNDEGFIDFDVALPAEASPGHVSIALEVERELVLATRLDDIQQSSPPVRPSAGPTTVHLKPNDLVVSLELRHGVLTVPVSDELRVSWPDRVGGEAGPSQLTLELEGAQGPGGQQTFVVESGERLDITPAEHIVEVTLRTPNRGLPASSTGVALLPLIPGAVAARLTSDDAVRVISPVPRSEVYVAFAAAARVHSFYRVGLAPATGHGAAPLFQGTVALPSDLLRWLEHEPVWAVTSSEPDFSSEAQVGWPLNRLAEGRSTRFGWGGVHDGFEQQRQRAEARRHRWKWLAWLGLLGTSVGELILLFVLIQRPASVEGPFRESPPRVWLWIAASCVVLGFAGLGGLFGFW